MSWGLGRSCLLYTSTVKMYSGESMYLDLSTAYDKTVAGEMDVEADSFYKFDKDVYKRQN